LIFFFQCHLYNVYTLFFLNNKFHEEILRRTALSCPSRISEIKLLKADELRWIFVLPIELTPPHKHISSTHTHNHIAFFLCNVIVSVNRLFKSIVWYNGGIIQLHSYWIALYNCRFIFFCPALLKVLPKPLHILCIHDLQQTKCLVFLNFS